MLEILEQQKQAAQRRFAEVEAARRRITDQIAEHRARLDQPAMFHHTESQLHLLMVDATLKSDARLVSELQQLAQLLSDYDQEHFAPRRRELEDATRKVAGMQKLIDRRVAAQKKRKERAAQAAVDNSALQRWIKGRSGRRD